MKVQSLVLIVACLYGSSLGAVLHLRSHMDDDESAELQSEDEESEPSTSSFSSRSNLSGDWGSGGYEFSIGLSKPTFSKINHYSELFGQTSYYPSFAATYKLVYMPYMTLGVGFKFSYYTDQGRPARVRDDGEIYPDERAESNLTLVPYQIFLSGQMTPFNSRYVVLNAWLGYEELYYEDVRMNKTQSATTTTTTTTANTSTTTTEATQNEINSGWNKSLTFGVAVNFLLNPFDENSASSLRQSTGLRFIYVAPFAEFTSTLSGGRTFITQQLTSPVDFARTSYGVLFMFET